MSHPLLPPKAIKETISRDSGTPQWPQFRGVPQKIGSSPSGRVTVYIDHALQQAMQNAHDLINDADRVVQQNDALFGTTGAHVNVVIWALNGRTDGTGGADHASCDYDTGGDIEVCASLGNSQRVSALFEAELSECSMGGNLCGVSTGEALSRWCAAVLSNNALADFATAPTWFNDGMPDFVNRTDPTDQGTDSTGCGMAFISWLISQGYALNVIAPAMVSLGAGGTFAQLYAMLTSQDAGGAWPKFQAAIRELPGGITTDDPFGGLAQWGGIQQIAPWMPEVAGKVFSKILADLAADVNEAQLVDDVRTILAASPVKRSLKRDATRQSSHPLVPPGGN